MATLNADMEVSLWLHQDQRPSHVDSKCLQAQLMVNTGQMETTINSNRCDKLMQMGACNWDSLDDRVVGAGLVATGPNFNVPTLRTTNTKRECGCDLTNWTDPQ